MNCVELAVQRAKDRPQGNALWLPGRRADATTSFGELLDRAARAQRALDERGLRPGDTALLLDELGPRVYATVMAVLAMGASIMLVEPWMRLSSIELAVRLANPRLCVANSFGRFWGLRVPAVRAIGSWVAARSLDRAEAAPSLRVEAVDPNSTGILTFTSGTTGIPKGVVRSHGYLVQQHGVLSRSLQLDRFAGHDLCIFPSFVLTNLASGRGTILIPPAWKPSHLRQIDQLEGQLRPDTTTCGPGFLLHLMRSAAVRSLRSIHVGGALTDCWILEEGFRRWPEATWCSVYGSTEAEPVAVCDSRRVVRKSREAGRFQALFLGHPVPEIEADVRDGALWVTGPHVCPLYLGDSVENRTQKRRDVSGRIWHCMGDRIRVTDSKDQSWWYAGRLSQSQEDFELEQKVYARLQSSKAFIHRSKDGRTALVGEGVRALTGQIAGVDDYVEARIWRDSRHRARIDRRQTLHKEARWLLG